MYNCTIYGLTTHKLNFLIPKSDVQSLLPQFEAEFELLSLNIDKVCKSFLLE